MADYSVLRELIEELESALDALPEAGDDGEPRALRDLAEVCQAFVTEASSQGLNNG